MGKSNQWNPWKFGRIRNVRILTVGVYLLSYCRYFFPEKRGWKWDDFLIFSDFVFVFTILSVFVHLYALQRWQQASSLVLKSLICVLVRRIYIFYQEDETCNWQHEPLKVNFPPLLAPVRIWIRIDPPHPLVCHNRPLNGAFIRIRSEKPRPRVPAGVARYRSLPAQRPWAPSIGLNFAGLHR
jgi:hypothetical protein